MLTETKKEEEYIEESFKELLKVCTRCDKKGDKKIN